MKTNAQNNIPVAGGRGEAPRWTIGAARAQLGRGRIGRTKRAERTNLPLGARLAKVRGRAHARASARGRARRAVGAEIAQTVAVCRRCTLRTIIAGRARRRRQTDQTGFAKRAGGAHDLLRRRGARRTVIARRACTVARRRRRAGRTVISNLALARARHARRARQAIEARLAWPVRGRRRAKRAV